MRITNRMMTTNMLNNINRNKNSVNFAGYQYQTQNKIEKPSDDPVVAVRSLKFATQITELEQYLDKNISDAEAWMKVTEDSMTEMNDIFQTIITYCTQAPNGPLDEKNRNSILETMRQYKEQVYALADSDYAGRYVFTGFRTDKALLFDAASVKNNEINNTLYTIKENLSFADINTKSYVKGGAEYAAGTSGDDYAKKAPTLESANRLQLSYADLDKGPKSIVTKAGTDFERNTGLQGITFTNPLNTAQKITLPDGGASGYNLKTVSPTDGDQGACYTAGDKEILFVPETGELIFGKDAYAMAQKYSDISVDYTKSKFSQNDIIPEHYFECNASNIVVNTGGSGYKDEKTTYKNPDTQKIDYEINFSQKLTVNTLAKDAVSTSLGTKIEEIVRLVNETFDITNKITEVNKLIETTTDETEKANLQSLKEQLETEKTLKSEVLRSGFASAITTTQKVQEQLNVALANHGSRDLRLDLTKSRLSDQKISFQTLKDSNDKVDLEDSMINYEQASVIYQASLSCASTVVSKSLLDYL